MKLSFTKMQGLGNDFAIFDGINQPMALSPRQIQSLADRHFGIGFDQLLLVESARSKEADFSYRIFNADGGEVEQCGNGARCFARFIHDKGLSNKRELVIETKAGLLRPRLQRDGMVAVDMGCPTFEPAEIPFIAAAPAQQYRLELGDATIELSALALGNPHAVIVVEALDSAPVETLGPAIECHPSFPERVNVGFMQILNSGQIKLRVYERGTGETLACGSGACAAVVAGIRLGLLQQRVQVALPGGLLTVEWSGDNNPVQLTGPATTVFEGTIEL